MSLQAALDGWMLAQAHGISRGFGGWVRRTLAQILDWTIDPVQGDLVV